MLRNILGPVFNLYLDQLLTYKICYFFVFFCFFVWVETPNFIVFSAKNAKFKETQKRKKTLFVNTIVLTALVKVSVFSAFFIFAVFFNFRFFEDVFVWFPKIKKYKKRKQAKQKTRTKARQKMQSKNKWNIMIQNKARQQAEQQKPKNNLKEERKQNKKEKQ